MDGWQGRCSIMENSIETYNDLENEDKSNEIVYNSEKDFYKGLSGELRYKAEGLFKKAREKGISIEEISIATLRENSVEFPGIGATELPTYIVKVKGRHTASGQVIVDGKQIDYFNRYQKYVADKIEKKNVVRDEKGKLVRENGRVKLNQEKNLLLTEWERFEIGKDLVEDKEFGMEKAITGACDRVIRKLMGENDWLYPEEARLLDEEFKNVQDNIIRNREAAGQALNPAPKKATDRQINYLKARIKNSGMEPDNGEVIKEILKQMGYGYTSLNDLSTAEMSKVIDGFFDVVQKVKENLGAGRPVQGVETAGGQHQGSGFKQ